MATITKSDLLNPAKPLIPVLEEQSAPRRKRNSVIMAASLALTVVVTALAFILVRSQENESIQAQFHLDSADRARALHQEMQLNVELMQWLISFYTSSELVERGEFESFLAAPAAKYPWVQAFQWVPLVSNSDREAFEQAVRGERFPEFQITELNANGEIGRAGDRPQYCPITFMAPFELNRRAHGFDHFSHPARRQTLLDARDSGEMRVSPRVQLLQGDGGLLLAAPIFQTYPVPLSQERRRAEAIGFCVGVFRIQSIVAHALKSARSNAMNLALFDETKPDQLQLLDYHSGEPFGGIPDVQTLLSPEGLQHSASFEVAGRSWRVVCTPSRTYEAGYPRWKSWSALGGGVALTSFLALSFWQARRYSESLEGRVVRRTQQLAEAYHDLEGEIRVRRHAEKALRQNQEQLQAILNNTTSVVYLKDRQGRYLLVNERYKWLFGVADEGVIGHTDHDIFPSSVADMVRTNDLKVLIAEKPLEMEEVVPYKGEPRTYLSIKFPLRDDKGIAYAVCGISTDITERKRMEEALEASQQRYDLIITGIKDGIWDWNLMTNEVYFSPNWKSMLGYGENEIRNSFSAWQELLHPDDAERSALTLKSFLAGNRELYELEHRLRHRDGTYRWILARGVALRDGSGRPVRLAGSHIDLTERKHAEDQLRQANVALGERERELTRALADLERTHEKLQSTQLQLIQAEKLDSIGKLAAGVAHEVKNPLQTMLMGITYLESQLTSASEDVKLTCVDMREAISRADAIIRGLLQLSGTPEINMVLGDLNVVLEKVLSLVNYSCNAARVTVERRMDQNLPLVWLDQGKMEQVFINLLTNAIHAMHQGGTIYLTTTAEPSGERLTKGETPRRVIVEIRDTGHGISAENLSRLFTPFFTTKEKGLGTGLGLSVTRSIVELHGGHIELDNAPGGGAVVTVTLQAAKENNYEKSTVALCG